MLDNTLGHGTDLKTGEEDVVILVKARKERSLGVARVHGDGADAGCAVASNELGGKTLVERHGSRLGGAIVDHGWCGDKGCERGDGDNHAVVALDHAGQEGLGDPVVRQRVDVKGEAHITGRGIENSLAAGDTGVVDEDGWVADLAADLVGDLVDVGG